MKNALLLFTLLFATTFGLKAQTDSNQNEKNHNWTFVGSAKYVTQHYWRGLGKGPLFGKAPAFEPNFLFTNGKFSAGVSFGASFDNVYKAMIPWVSYSPVKGLKIGISDIYSPGTNFWKTKITNFDLATSKHFVDATIDYKLPFNVGLKWATLIAGGDRKPGEPTKRNFTSYAEINYGYKWDRISVSAAVGMTPWKGLYNSKKAGINNMEAKLQYTVPLYGKMSLPVFAVTGYNPLADYFQFLVGASIVIPYKL